jgi:hypothetical protein
VLFDAAAGVAASTAKLGAKASVAAHAAMLCEARAE